MTPEHGLISNHHHRNSDEDDLNQGLKNFFEDSLEPLVITGTSQASRIGRWKTANDSIRMLTKESLAAFANLFKLDFCSSTVKLSM